MLVVIKLFLKVYLSFPYFYNFFVFEDNCWYFRFAGFGVEWYNEKDDENDEWKRIHDFFYEIETLWTL